MEFFSVLSFLKILSIGAIIITVKAQESVNDYYSSLIGVQTLAKQEQKLVAKLVRYKKKLTDSVELIDYFLDDYSNSIHTVIKRHPQLREKFGKIKYPILKTETDLNIIAEQISANPLMAFKLLRRFVIELADVESNTDQIKDHLEFKDFINNLANSMHRPSLNDMNGAADGLLRLQETYQLPTAKMSKGVILEKKTGCELQATDMQFIGARAITYEQRYATGLEWLYAAYEKVLKGDDSLPMDVLKSYLLVSRNLHNDEFLKFSTQSANLFSNLVNSTFTNIPEMFKPPVLREYDLGFKYATVFDEHNFKALCRGEQLLSPNVSKSLRCWYSHTNSAYNIISPLKVEMHHENPPVLQIYDLISDNVINYIKNVAHPLLKRSEVVGNAKLEISSIRTSSVAWLKDRNTNDTVLSQIPHTVRRVTGLVNDLQDSAEDLQVSCYGSVGGFYLPHFDSIIERATTHSPEEREDLKKGDRVATLMFYLNDVELGGGTAFPRLGVAVKAIKGSAVFWYNLKLSGYRHPLSLHGGCPVLLGNKWVANKWIRLFDQLHVRKCGLHRLA